MTARLFNGAPGLPMSGRSAGIPSLLRSEPLATVNGVPDWNVATPAIDHPPKPYFHQPDRGPGSAHRVTMVSRCGRSKSLNPRSSFNAPWDTGTDVRFI